MIKQKYKHTLRSPEVRKAIGDYMAMGLGYKATADKIADEFGMKLVRQDIYKMYKKYSVSKKEIMQSDKEMALLYRSTLLKVRDKIEGNITRLDKISKIIDLKLKEIKDIAPASKILELTREIDKQVRTQNDTIRTLIEWLKRLEIETKETKVSTIKTVQMTISHLKELEKQGYIKIMPEYYNNNQLGQEQYEDYEDPNVPSGSYGDKK